jgi:hypothetical protein
MLFCQSWLDSWVCWKCECCSASHGEVFCSEISPVWPWLPPLSVAGITASITMISFSSNVMSWFVGRPWILVAVSFQSLSLVPALSPIFLVGFAPAFEYKYSLLNSDNQSSNE